MPDTENSVLGTPEDQVDAAPNVDATEVTDPEALKSQTEEHEEDPLEAAIKARLDLEADKLRQELTEQVRRDNEAQRETERKTREDQEAAQRLYNSFGETVRTVRDNLKKQQFWDDNGNKRSLTDDEIQELVVNPLARHNLIGEQAASFKVQKALADTALSRLTDEARKDFTEKATGKDLGEWLDHFTEARAGDSDYVKRLKKEHDAAVKAAEARGYAQAQKRAAAPPSSTSSKEPAPKTDVNVDYNTAGGLSRALSLGHINESEFNERWLKLNT